VNKLPTEATGQDCPSIANLGVYDGWLNQFTSAWWANRRLTAADFLARHPHLADDDELTALLMVEEFNLRTEEGEELDSQAFFGQLPGGYKEVVKHRAVYKGIGGPSGIVSALRALGKLPTVGAPTMVDSQAKFAAGTIKSWPQPGELIGGFRLSENLGQGAFAHVYLAEELSLGCRQVVVKASLKGGHEADTLGRLEHPNIVPIFSVHNEADYGLTLICMPYLGRVTLQDIVGWLFREGRPRPTHGRHLIDALTAKSGLQQQATADPRLANATYVDAVTQLGAQLADALAYTNSKAILHGDLKPSNVLLDASGKPMLLDFNLSFDAARRTGYLGATLGYSAPEIVAGLVSDSEEKVVADPRSDLYSWGVILYELLTGRLPFGKPVGRRTTDIDYAAAWLALQSGQPRPMAGFNPEVSPELAALIERCLAYDVGQRPRKASDVAAELRQLLTRRSRLKRWSRHHRRAVAAMVMTFFLAIAAGSYALATRAPYAERQFAAARAAAELGDYQQALVYLADAQQHGFDSQQIAELRGEAHYRLAKHAFDVADFAAARDECGKAIDAGRKTWQAYLLRARSKFHLREFDAALGDITAAEARTALPQLYSARGDCLCSNYKWDAAIRAYGKALAEGFGSGRLSNNLAFAMINSGRRSEALEYLDRAIAIDESLADAYYQRACVSAATAIEKGQDVPVAAVNDIQNAMELLPTNYRAFLWAARIHAWHAKSGGANDRKQAINCLLQALRFGLNPAQIPSQEPLGSLASEIRASPEFAEAIAQGSRSVPVEPPGLVDSLAGLDFD
jgi:serine/threonine protein kinase/predicted negative regulator of RcsB-dependent stress response